MGNLNLDMYAQFGTGDRNPARIITDGILRWLVDENTGALKPQSGQAASGFLRTARVDFMEDATSTQMQALVPIPAGSIIQEMSYQNRAAWVSANLITGSGWTLGTGWAESPDEVFTHTPGNTAALTHSGAIVAGRAYIVTVTNASGTDGNVTVSLGGVSFVIDGNDAPNTLTRILVAVDTTGFAITPTSLYDGVIEEVSVYFGATLAVGDTADPNGYMVAQLLDGNSVEFSGCITDGAYTNGDGGLIGPTSNNFGWNYVAGSNIIATITNPVPSATAGRTTVVVYYTVPESIPVVSS